MEPPNEIEQRLTELEIKASFSEDLLDQLNQTLFRQQQVPEDGAGEARSLRDELPPHY